MSSRRSRMSLGPGSLPSALSDASGRANRRTSFGGGGGSDDEGSRAGGGVSAAEPKKDIAARRPGPANKCYRCGSTEHFAYNC